MADREGTVQDPAARLIVRRHAPSELPGVRDALLGVYEAAHAERMGDAWFHPDRFWRQVIDVYAVCPEFCLVTGWVDDSVFGRTMVGYAMGATMVVTDATWRAIVERFPDPPAERSVFGLQEIAVDPGHRRRGYARLLHYALLDSRREVIAYLAVLLDNASARAAYQRWGWRSIDVAHPDPELPACAEEMALRLPQRPEGREFAAPSAGGG